MIGTPSSPVFINKYTLLDIEEASDDILSKDVPTPANMRSTKVRRRKWERTLPSSYVISSVPGTSLQLPV